MVGGAALLVGPSFQTFQIAGVDSTLFGYSFDDSGSSGGHYVQVWDSLSPREMRATMLRMACHFLVDMVPTSGLDEMLEKTIELRDYYCSLANWSAPALIAPIPVAVAPVVARYERDSFSYPEE